MRQDDRYDADVTPSRVVAERFRVSIDDGHDEASLALVHYRGGQEEFDLGIEYAISSDPLDRVTGARILAQLGWGDRTFLEDSVSALLSMLEDPDGMVVSAAATALGHRKDPKAVPALVRLAAHPNADIRFGVAFGLLGHSHPDAIQAMIGLAGDPDLDIRNWATFGLGSQIEDDTPEIREALRGNLMDADHEVRGEAIVGPASRKEPNIIDILTREWGERDGVSVLSLEAAEIAADPRLLGHLERFRADLSIEGDSKFARALDEAIRACKGEAGLEIKGAD